MKYYLKRNRHRILRASVLLALLATSLIGLRLYLDNRGVVVSVVDSSDMGLSGEINTIESRVLNFGSINWAGAPGNIEKSFDNLSKFSRTDYEAWVINLACQIEVGTGCKDTLSDDFKRWFNIVSIDNLDSGREKTSSTTELLDSNGLQYFGNSNITQKDLQCGVVALPARLVLDNQTYRQASMPIVLCGMDATKTLNIDLNHKISELSSTLPVWVYAIDSGVATHEDLQKIYRSYIDAGADMVLGVSRSSLAITESYKGRLIAYSLGMFMGDGGMDSSIYSTLIGVKTSIEWDENIMQWSEIAKTCSGYEDLCIDAGKSRNLYRPSYTYNFTIQGVDRSDQFSPTPTDSQTSSEVARIVDWIATSGKLSNVQQEAKL